MAFRPPTRLPAEHPQPLDAEAQRDPGPGGGDPRRARHRAARPAEGGVRRERDGARGARVRAGAHRNEGHRHAPLEVQERRAAPAEAAEIVAEEGAAPAQHEGAVRGEPRGRRAPLSAHQQPRGAGRHEHVPRGGEPQVGAAAVRAPGLERRVPVEVAAHREALAAAAEGELRQVHAGAAERGVGAEGAARGRGADGERADGLPPHARAPFGARAHAAPVAEPAALGEVVVAVVAAEFLRRERVHERRRHRPVAHVAHLAIQRRLERRAARAQRRGEARRHPAVARAVARERAQVAPLAAAAQHHARAHGEPLHPVRVHHVGEAAHAQAPGLEAAHRVASGDPLDLGAHPRQVVLAHRLGDVLNRGVERHGPRERVAGRLGKERDLVAREQARGEPQVEAIAVDLPAAADDAAGGHVEPGGAAADLDLLAIGKPPALLPQGVVEHDAHVLELRVAVGARGEIERHAHQVGRLGVHIQGAHDARQVELLGADPQGDDADLAAREGDDRGVAEGEVVGGEPAERQRVRHVAHLVPLAEADRRPEIVLDDAEVVAVVGDVGGELGLVAPADDALLAARGRLPVHFQLQLVGLDEARRLGEPFAEGAEKEEEPVGLGLVIAESGVGGGASAAQDGAAREREGGVGVPRLGGRGRSEGGEGGGSSGGSSGGGDQGDGAGGRGRGAHRREISRLPRVSDARDAFLDRAARAASAPCGGMVPVVREVVLDADTPLAAFVKIARPPFAFLLESLVGGERWARYTFLGTEPREVWRYRGRGVERWTPETGWRPAGETDDPIGHLAERLRALPAVAVPGLPRFTGGAVGYLGYDLVRTIERLPAPPPDTLGVPDAVLMIADTVVILDNLFGRAIVVANVEVPAAAPPAERLRRYDAALARLEELAGRLRGPHPPEPLAIADNPPPVRTESRYPRERFERDVARVLDYIAAGDTFQTVLSRRQEAPGAVDPLRLYRYLRALNPAPYLFHLAFDEFAFVGSSPEVLVRVEGQIGRAHV